MIQLKKINKQIWKYKTVYFYCEQCLIIPYGNLNDNEWSQFWITIMYKNLNKPRKNNISKKLDSRPEGKRQ